MDYDEKKSVRSAVQAPMKVKSENNERMSSLDSFPRHTCCHEIYPVASLHDISIMSGSRQRVSYLRFEACVE